MSLSSTTTKISYAGNGATTVFSFPYYFLTNADLVVISKNNTTLVETVKTITTHYTVAGAGVSAGGTVTMLTAPATGTTLIIYRDPSATQDLDLAENDVLPSTEVEKALDKNAMLSQRIKETVTRALKVPEGFNTTAFDLTVPADLSDNPHYAIIVNTAGDGFTLGPSLDPTSTDPIEFGGSIEIDGNLTVDGNLILGGATISATELSYLDGTTSTVVSINGTQTLTNKTLTSPIISQISNTGTLTLPTSTDTLVGKATTDTLTNKTLTSPTITSPTLSGTITASSVILATSAAIGYSFTDDSNTGIFNTAADTVDIYTGGSNRFRISSSAISSNNIIFVPDGSAAAPTYAFTNSQTTGLYRKAADVVGLAIAGVEKAYLSSAGLNVVDQFLGNSTGVAHSFTSDTDTGLVNGAADTLDFFTGGANRLRINNTSVSCQNLVFVPNGSAAAPTYAFTNSQTTGLYRKAADVIGLAIAGVEKASLNATGLNVVDQFLGNSTGVTYSFTDDTDTGLVNGAANTIDFFTGGSNRLRINDTSVSTQNLLFVPNGSAAAPTFAFTNSQTTGFYRSAADIIGVACAGVSAMTISGTGFTSAISSSAELSWIFSNTEAVTGTSNSAVKIRTGGTASGDPYLQFRITSGAGDFSLGLDNSDSDTFKISQASSLGTNDFLTITTAGLVTIGSGTATTHQLNTAVANTASAGAQTLPANPVGFITININGTARKIPYYAT